MPGQLSKVDPSIIRISEANVLQQRWNIRKAGLCTIGKHLDKRIKERTPLVDEKALRKPSQVYSALIVNSH